MGHKETFYKNNLRCKGLIKVKGGKVGFFGNFIGGIEIGDTEGVAVDIFIWFLVNIGNFDGPKDIRVEFLLESSY